MDTQRRKVRIALLSVASSTTLVIMKLLVGLMIGSVSIISEAIHFEEIEGNRGTLPVLNFFLLFGTTRLAW